MTRSSRTLRAAGIAVVLVLLPALLSGCTVDPPGEPPAGPVPAGAIRGELDVMTATFDDGTTDEQYYLLVGGDPRNEQRLLFPQPPDLPSGTRLDVWGTAGADGLQVARWQRTPGQVEQVQQRLIGAEPVRPRSFAMVLVDVGGGVNITAAEAERRLFGTEPGTTPSVRQYFIEASYGRQDVGGKVFGPFQYTMNGCDTRGLVNAIKPMLQGTYDHYLWYIGSKVSACGWSGLASGGSIARPARDTWYNASAGCVVLVQEPGHNFGMRHSSSMRCPNATFVDAPEMTCTHSEYGDSYDPMGRGCRHMNGAQKSYLGWFGKCNVAEVTGSGTFTLLPLELPCNGVQVLQVKMPKVRPFYRSGGGGSAGITELTHYYVELRAPHGIDKALQPVVQIRASADTRMSSQRAAHTWFLDTNPATTTLDGLVAGGMFADPGGGLTIRVESLDATKATIRVDVAGAPEGTAATCLDGTTLPGTGPGPESCAAAPASINGAPPPVIPDGGAGTGGSGAGGSGAGGSGGAGGNRDAAGGSGAGGSGGSGNGPPTGGSGSGTGGAGGSGTGGGTGGSSSAGGSTGSGGSGTGGARPGTGGSNAGRGGTTGSGTGGSNTGTGQDPPVVPGGCGCEVGGVDRAAGGWPALAFGIVLWFARRSRLSRRR